MKTNIDEFTFFIPITSENSTERHYDRAYRLCSDYLSHDQIMRLSDTLSIAQMIDHARRCRKRISFALFPERVEVTIHGDDPVYFVAGFGVMR